MLDDNDAYYLMAYEPSNTKRDGKFRKIEVRLPRRSGLVVRTRKGYLAPDDRKEARSPDRLARPGRRPAWRAAPALDEAEARAVLSVARPRKGTPVRLVVDYLDLPPAGAADRRRRTVRSRRARAGGRSRRPSSGRPRGGRRRLRRERRARRAAVREARPSST